MTSDTQVMLERDGQLLGPLAPSSYPTAYCSTTCRSRLDSAPENGILMMNMFTICVKMDGMNCHPIY